MANITVGVTPGKDYATLQAALNACVSGDTLLLTAGETYSGPFHLLDKGASPAYITITTAGFTIPAGQRVVAADASQMAKVNQGHSYNTSAAMYTKPNTHHYKIIGIEFSMLDPSDPGVSVGYDQYGCFVAGYYGYDSLVPGQASGVDFVQTSGEMPHHITIDRCYMHGTDKGQHVYGAFMNVADWEIKNCRIEGFHHTYNDAQAILCIQSPGPALIDNNYLSASGEVILFGGGGGRVIPGMVPSDIIITNNYMFKPPQWNQYDALYDGGGYGGQNYSAKNIFEIKNAQRVLIDHNILDGSFGDNQRGVAFTLTPRNQSNTQFSAADGAGIITYRATAGSAATMTFPVHASSVDHYYEGGAVKIVSGTGYGATGDTVQLRVIVNYVGATRVATMQAPWITIPDNTTEFSLGWPFWAECNNVTISNNVVRNCWRFMSIQGYDNFMPTQQAHDITVTNNLFYKQLVHGSELDILEMQAFPSIVNFTHNTFQQTDVATRDRADVIPLARCAFVLAAYGSNAKGYFNGHLPGVTETIEGFTFDNNIITRLGYYEILGDTVGGNDVAISTFLITPSISHNVLGDHKSLIFSPLPATSILDAGTYIDAQFQDPANGIYQLKDGSPYLTAASDGGRVGVNMENGLFPDPAGDGKSTYRAASGPSNHKLHGRFHR